MKKFASSLLASLLMFSFPVSAEVQIQLEDGISLLAVNGKEVTKDHFSSNSNIVKLADGVNQLLVRYTAEIKTSADEYELETTDAFVLLINTENNHLKIKSPNLRSEKQVNRFNKTGTWLIIDGQGNPISIKSSVLKKDGFQLARNFEYELAEFNTSNSDAALPTSHRFSAINASTTFDAPSTVRPANQSKIDIEKDTASQMLRYWYQQADEETREHFKKWINQ